MTVIVAPTYDGTEMVATWLPHYTTKIPAHRDLCAEPGPKPRVAGRNRTHQSNQLLVPQARWRLVSGSKRKNFRAQMVPLAGCHLHATTGRISVMRAGTLPTSIPLDSASRGLPSRPICRLMRPWGRNLIVKRAKTYIQMHCVRVALCSLWEICCTDDENRESKGDP